MRKKSSDREFFDEQYQMLEFAMSPNNPLAAELKAIDQLLDEIPEILDLVNADINSGASNKGRPTEISAEQILRSAILMQLRGLPYRQLAAELDVNGLYRKFTRFYERKIPHFTQLNDLIKMISPQTMEQVNEAIVKIGIKKKVENGKSIRLDTTVSQTNILYPIDARLLNDSVRVMARLLQRLQEAAPGLTFTYRNHTRRSKKRAYQIVMAKGKNIEQRRQGLYRDLLEVQKKVRGYVEQALAAVNADLAAAGRIEVMALAVELENILSLAEQVYNQAYRRKIEGEKVPADEKLLSIFETHTDIICRGKKGSKAEFGHKINFATGRSGLITWYDVLEGNPGDNEVLLPALDKHISTFGLAPKKLTADRRYYSADNEEKVKGKGVEQVALPKPGYLSAARRNLQKTRWFRRLLRWRGGIEGCLSTLLRSFGLKRCLWKGWQSFKAYVGLGVLTYNLRLLAGHLAQA